MLVTEAGKRIIQPTIFFKRLSYDNLFYFISFIAITTSFIGDCYIESNLKTKPTGRGTGLGLSLSYDIITKEHGGELKVESVEGAFSEFIIILPKT